MADQVIYAQVINFSGDPFFEGKSAFHYIENGVVVIKGEKIDFVGESSALPAQYRELPAQDYKNHILSAGFVDCHLHFPQTRMIGAFGSDLIYWLNRYTFPEEARYKDFAFSEKMAKIFIRQLNKHGITTCCAFSTSHVENVEALFQVAAQQNRCLFTGKTMMDRNAVEEIHDTPKSSYDDSLALASKWHGVGRNNYVISPRFAITSTPEQLEMAGQLVKDLPESYVQTHINESHGEIEAVRSLFPKARDYLGVYEEYGLVHERTLLAHGIHNTPRELELMSAQQAKIVHCPTSNNFLGSGQFSAKSARENNILFGFGCDIGGGSTFSSLETMGDAYKVARFHDVSITALESFYLATLGGAKLLGKDHEIGRIEKGYYADMILLNPCATELMAQRTELSNEIEGGIEDILFSMQFADGPNNAIEKVWISGNEMER